MLIEELNGEVEEELQLSGSSSNSKALSSGGGLVAKRVLVGAGARALFYPTLLYNVIRNKFQTEFRWWDPIDQYLLLGAVPFPSDVKRLKELGVSGVVTMNEPYETLVPTSLYQAHGINHLVLPTRDYLFAPSLKDISRAVDFIYENASQGRTTYVHCKAGRGRSTTIVICYLVQHKNMTPDAAYDYVKSIRPRVLLASAQFKVVHEYYHLKVMRMCNSSYRRTCSSRNMNNPVPKPLRFFAAADLFSFDDGSVVLVSKADLDGYDTTNESVDVRGEIWANPSLVYHVRAVSEAALTRLSCLWLGYNTDNMISNEKLQSGSGCLVAANQGGLTVNIHIY